MSFRRFSITKQFTHVSLHTYYICCTPLFNLLPPLPRLHKYPPTSYNNHLCFPTYTAYTCQILLNAHTLQLYINTGSSSSTQTILVSSFLSSQNVVTSSLSTILYHIGRPLCCLTKLHSYSHLSSQAAQQQLPITQFFRRRLSYKHKYFSELMTYYSRTALRSSQNTIFSGAYKYIFADKNPSCPL